MASSDISPELDRLLTAMNNLLPFEIVSKILDYAELWYCDHSVTVPRPPPRSPRYPGLRVTLGPNSKGVLLMSRSLSHQDISMLRRITFSFAPRGGKWHDKSLNGWMAGLISSQERSQLSGLAPSNRAHFRVARNYPLQKIRGADQETEEHNITLDKWHGHQLFEDLCTNDSIVLTVYAQYSGRWNSILNHVESANLKLWMADFRRVPSNGPKEASNLPQSGENCREPSED
jgi:hypothetical protein